MKRPLRALVLIFIVFLLIGGVALSKTVTPTPRPVAATPAPLPFSGGSNSISGNVYDASGNGIPNAKVTLYYTAWVGTEYKAKEPVNNIVNPQYTSDGQLSPAGLYVYTGIQSGVYVLTAEKGGISVSKVIMVTGGTTTENLFIQGYLENKATPTPAPSAGPTSAPTTRPADPQKTDLGALFFEVLKIGLMGIVGIQFIVSIVAIILGRRN
jgi:hypothetical protein